MDLQWHERLIDRLIKNNQEATIKDYWKIIDPNEKITVTEEGKVNGVIFKENKGIKKEKTINSRK